MNGFFLICLPPPLKLFCGRGLREAVSWHICPRSSIPLWQSLNTRAKGWMTAWVSRINLPQIRYSNGSFLHINSCIYRDYFGNLPLLLWKHVPVLCSFPGSLSFWILSAQIYFPYVFTVLFVSLCFVFRLYSIVFCSVCWRVFIVCLSWLRSPLDIF